MQIEDKYELLEAVTGLGGTEDITVPAWEKSTGKLAFVHILAGGYNQETKALLISIGTLGPEDRQHVLGAGDYSGSPYVVTDALPWERRSETGSPPAARSRPSSSGRPIRSSSRKPECGRFRFHSQAPASRRLTQRLLLRQNLSWASLPG